MPGVIIGQGALGNSLTIKLDMPIGGGQRGGFLHRQSRGEDLIAIDDAARVRPRTLANVQPSGVPNEIVELARAGKAGRRSSDTERSTAPRWRKRKPLSQRSLRWVVEALSAAVVLRTRRLVVATMCGLL